MVNATIRVRQISRESLESIMQILDEEAKRVAVEVFITAEQ